MSRLAKLPDLTAANNRRLHAGRLARNEIAAGLAAAGNSGYRPTTAWPRESSTNRCSANNPATTTSALGSVCTRIKSDGFKPSALASPAARMSSIRSLAGWVALAMTDSAWPSAAESPSRTRNTSGGLSSCRNCSINSPGNRGSAWPSSAWVKPAINLSRCSWVGAFFSNPAQPMKSSCRPRAAKRRMSRSRMCRSTIGCRKNDPSRNSSSTAPRSFSQCRSSTHQHCSGINGSSMSSVRLSSPVARPSAWSRGSRIAVPAICERTSECPSRLAKRRTALKKPVDNSR